MFQDHRSISNLISEHIAENKQNCNAFIKRVLPISSFLVEGKSGAQVFSGTNVRLIGYGLHQMTVPAGGRESGFVPDGVLEDGTPITQSLDYTQQQNYWGRYNDVAEAGIYDSDYFRMRQMSVGYTFPKTMLEGTFIQSASVSLIGKNLFFIHNSVPNVDPESAYNNSNSQGLEFYTDGILCHRS